MVDVETAQERILSSIQPLGTEPIAVAESLGRILAQEVAAPIDLPSFDNSAMDGYAVRAEELEKATPEKPVELRQIGQVAAGAVFEGKWLPGTCVRIFTGSPLPQGADAVVMQEDTAIRPEKPDVIQVRDRVKPWENIRFQGEDIKKGEVMAPSGDSVTVARLGLMTALGIQQLRVHRRPRVGLIATGSELCELHQSLGPGQIYESNRTVLAALIRSAGGEPLVYPIVRDNPAETEQTLERALAASDVVVSSGGASVGEWDLVRSAFERVNGHLDFWKIAMRPGKPFAFGRWKEKYFFALPGNPVSAFVTFLLLVRPALLRLQGAQDCGLPVSWGILGETVTNRGDRRHFLRVVLDRSGKVNSAGVQGSHRLASLARANGLLDLPPGATLKEESPVQVLRWTQA